VKNRHFDAVDKRDIPIKHFRLGVLHFDSVKARWHRSRLNMTPVSPGFNSGC